ncbi:polysaccharide deacetylase family protein [Halalkalicoccus salilacus]|uniref:polysaccharide deacetylase family protein n=1 Tax=Halalkalicoccus sp. GCM10025704 TaxID=3252662 RepID=UPI00360DAC53
MYGPETIGPDAEDGSRDARRRNPGGCLGRGSAEEPNEVSNESPPAPEPEPESEPEPEPEPAEPTLWLDEDSRDRCRNAGESWRDCESLDEWEVLEGSLRAETDIVYDGSQCAHLTADGDGATVVRIPIDGYDLSRTTFSLAAYIETPGGHYSPFFDVNDPEHDQQLHFRSRHKIDEPGWLRYDLGVAFRSNVESADEAYLTIAWHGSGADWYIDDIRAVPVTEEPHVIVQFDDSPRTTYDTAYPIMREYDIPATVFTITGRVGNSGSLTLNQMEEMQAEGWEFGSHTVSHPRLGDLPAEEQRHELEASKQWLLDHGFEQGAGLFAYPFGSFTAETVDVVSDYYRLATHGQRGATNRTVTAPLSANRHPGDDPERSMELLDLLMDERVPTDTLVLYYHEVIENHETWIDPEGFRETMAYVHDNDVPCMLTSDLWEHQIGL